MPPTVPLRFNFRAESARGPLKPKSVLFEALEAAVDQYVNNSTVSRLLALTAALGAWKVSKKRGTENWTNSIRADPVSDLSDWLIQESIARGVFPNPGPHWNSNHNCYAFAMNCASPQGM